MVFLCLTNFWKIEVKNIENIGKMVKKGGAGGI